jgi:predicted lipoprotein with Yx(FWY)xxD motif
MKRTALGVALLLIASACGTANSTDQTTSSIQPPTTDAPAKPSGALSASSFGADQILVAPNGGTLYVFEPDAQGDSTCYDQCEATWPPLVGTVEAGAGINASLIGETQRTDGAMQMTYNGWPLYSFANDAAVGDTNGQGLNGLWWVVSPEGTFVGKDGPPSDEGESFDLDY